MKAKRMPSARLLRRLIDYDPHTGEMRWKERPVWMFSDNKNGRRGNAATWNSRYAGKRAMGCENGNGYLVGPLLSKNYLAHRVAWAIYHGRAPNKKIDHQNGVRSDNRIENLRTVDDFANAQNMSLSKANRSGATGVSIAGNQWVARIRANGRQYHLGLFTLFDDALAARKAAERKYGFHPNHGRHA